MTDGTKDQELIRLRTELENATYLLRQEQEENEQLKHELHLSRCVGVYEAQLKHIDMLKKQLEIAVDALEKIRADAFDLWTAEILAKEALVRIREDLGGDVGTEGQSTSGSCAGSPIGVANQVPTSPTQPEPDPPTHVTGYIDRPELNERVFEPHGFEIGPPPDVLVSAKQDKVHKDTGIAKAAKVRKSEIREWNELPDAEMPDPAELPKVDEQDPEEE